MAEKVARALPELLDLEYLGVAAECLRTLAHPHRLRMVQLLLQGRFNVGELADACALPSHMASEQLRLMQRCGLLRSVREGRCTYYEIAQPHLAGIMACIESRYREHQAKESS
ncbi:MAG: ArsR/SmtB family transcription factor [Pirellulaceae bacterium]